MIDTIYSDTNFLQHYGVKGMKWGQRKQEAYLKKARRYTLYSNMNKKAAQRGGITGAINNYNANYYSKKATKMKDKASNYETKNTASNYLNVVNKANSQRDAAYKAAKQQYKNDKKTLGRKQAATNKSQAIKKAESDRTSLILKNTTSKGERQVAKVLAIPGIAATVAGTIMYTKASSNGQEFIAQALMAAGGTSATTGLGLAYEARQRDKGKI